MAFVTTLRSGLVSVRNLGAGHLRFWANRVEAGETRIENINRGNLDATIGTLRSALVTIRNLGSGRLEFWAETIKAQETRIENLGRGTLVAFVDTLRSSLVVIRNAGQGRLEFWADVVEAQETRIENLNAGTLVARINNLRSDLLTIRNAGQGRLAFWADTVEAQQSRIENLGAGRILTNVRAIRDQLVDTRDSTEDVIMSWADRVEHSRESHIDGLGVGGIWTRHRELRDVLRTTLQTAEDRLTAWTDRVEQSVRQITDLSDDLGGGSIAAELKKIVQNRLPKRFGEAIDQAFKNVFGAPRVKFFDQMRNLLGGNSALVTNLRALRDAIKAQQKDMINQYARGQRTHAANTISGTNVSVPTRSSAGRNKDQWGRLYDSSSGTLNLNSGSMSGWKHSNEQRYNKSWIEQYTPMFTSLAQQLKDLVGGSLPKVHLKAHTKDGIPTLTLNAGSSTYTFKKGSLDLDNIAKTFMHTLAHNMTGISSAVKNVIFDAWRNRSVPAGFEWATKQLEKAGALPGFADGGTHQGGLRIVGERGPELEYTGPSRIYSAPDTSRILSGFANDNGNFRELIAEVRALRAENAELRRTVSEGFGDTVQAEGQSGLALRGELRALREDVEDLQASTRQQARRRAA